MPELVDRHVPYDYGCRCGPANLFFGDYSCNRCDTSSECLPDMLRFAENAISAFRQQAQALALSGALGSGPLILIVSNCSAMLCSADIIICCCRITSRST